MIYRIFKTIYCGGNCRPLGFSMTNWKNINSIFREAEECRRGYSGKCNCEIEVREYVEPSK